jgi:hypothetical protein
VLQSLLADLLGWRPPICRCYLQRERICRDLFAKVMTLCRLRATCPYSEGQSQWMLGRIREKVELYDEIRTFGMPTTERLCEAAQVPTEARPDN